jgi:hypothetical protein
LKRATKTRDRKPAHVVEIGAVELLERQKNKIRGIVGAAHRHRREPGNHAMHLRTAVRRAIAEARYELPRAFRRDFFTWLDRTFVDGKLTLTKAASSGLISALIKSRRTSVAEELRWSSEIINRHSAELQRFVRLSENLDRSFWGNNWPKCQEALEEIKADFGDTFWVIGAEIALLQQFLGLDAQKTFTTKIRESYKAGLPAYLAYHLSIRNERGSTNLLFDEDFREQMQSSKLDRDTKVFLTYKMTGHHDLTDRAISTTIQLEQGSSIIDHYETIIDLLQRAACSERTLLWTDAAIDFLKSCHEIGDYRVTKLLVAYSREASPSQHGPSSRTADTLGNDLGDDFWSAIWPMVRAKRRAAEGADDESPVGLMKQYLASLIARDAAFEDCRLALNKFARNFAFVRSARAAGDFADFLTLRVRNTVAALAKPTLNSPGQDALNLLPAKDPSTTQRQLFSTSEGLPQELLTYRSALVDARTRPDAAKNLIDGIDLPIVSEGQANLIRNLVLQIELDGGESEGAIHLIGAEIARRPSVINAMPVQVAIGDRSWQSLAAGNDKLALAICLYAYWKQTDDSLRTTHLRFAFEDGLIALGVDLASHVEESLLRSDLKVRFFLAHVCIPVLMDTSGLFSSTDELLDERLSILKLLAKADPQNIEIYEDEAAQITASKLIKSGLEIVDGNRVAVDTGALTRWAIKRYREGYYRYAALRAAGIGSSEKFDLLFDRIKADPEKNAESFSIPDNEADSLLLGILLAIKDRFISDEQYGLEYFLGKRIRHGTITGHIRGPAETEKLITERSGPGRPYQPNTAWMSQLAFRSPECEREAQTAFINFSEQYDELIARARDRYLHVHSKSHPDGILDVTLDAFRFHVVRSMIRADVDFESFLNAYFTLLWTMLDQSLYAARVYLTETLKGEVVQLYGTLQERLRASVIQDEAAIQLSTVIQSTSTAVQRELDIVGNWFIRGESQHATHMFALSDVLEVAIQSALKSLPNFHPKIERVVSGQGLTTSAVLITVVDIMFIAFDNVLRRSRAGPNPRVEIEFRLIENNERLRIAIRNPVGDDLDFHATSEKLTRIQEKIDAGDMVKSAFVEGESGLLKVAAHANHYPGSTFSFSLDNDGFATVVEFPVIYLVDRFSLAPPADEQ